VITDTDLLSTLPPRELKAGYAEVLKYGLLGDASFFEELNGGLGTDILALKPEALARAIYVSCATKAKIVAEDERESGVRALLNLGHTFGHALELEAGYDGDLLHGEAVSAGMEMAFQFAATQGLSCVIWGRIKKMKAGISHLYCRARLVTPMLKNAPTVRRFSVI